MSVILRSEATKNLVLAGRLRFFALAEFILSEGEGLRLRMTVPLNFKLAAYSAVTSGRRAPALPTPE